MFQSILLFFILLVPASTFSQGLTNWIDPIRSYWERKSYQNLLSNNDWQLLEKQYWIKDAAGNKVIQSIYRPVEQKPAYLSDVSYEVIDGITYYYTLERTSQSPGETEIIYYPRTLHFSATSDELIINDGEFISTYSIHFLVGDEHVHLSLDVSDDNKSGRSRIFGLLELEADYLILKSEFFETHSYGSDWYFVNR